MMRSWCLPLISALAFAIGCAPALAQSPGAIAYVKVGVVNPINQAYQELTRGTGFVIDHDGHILTAKHLIQAKLGEIPGPRKITIALGYIEANPISAYEVQCGSGNIDICLIKVSAEAASALGVKEPYRISCRRPREQEAISAHGFPFMPGNEVLKLPGRINGSISPELKYPTDLHIVPGMSGGPVMDSNGVVVAMNAGGAPGYAVLTFVQPLFYGKSVIEASGQTCSSSDEATPPDVGKTMPPATKLEGKITLPREVTELRYGRLTVDHAVLRMVPPDGAEAGRPGPSGAAGIPGQNTGASGGPGGKGADGEHGSDGVSASKLILSATVLEGALTIDARGQAGGAGGIGGVGGAGGAGARGDSASSGAFDCRRGPGRGGNGGAGGHGGDGGSGGQAGSGGVVEVHIERLTPGSSIEILNGAGTAGPAGPGGTGGSAGSPGAEGSSDGWCKPAGRDGAGGVGGTSGRNGLPGQPGTSGSITLTIGNQTLRGSGRVSYEEPLKRF